MELYFQARTLTPDWGDACSPAPWTRSSPSPTSPAGWQVWALHCWETSREKRPV